MKTVGLYFIGLVALFAANMTSAQTCSTTSDGKYDVLSVPQDQNGYDHNCDFTADILQLSIYGIFVCANEPTPENYQQQCSELFFDETPKVANISKGNVSSLGVGELSIEEGSYNYAAVIVKPTVGVSFVNNYTHPLRGATSVGTTCWTNGVDIAISYSNPSEFSVECGTENDANPRVSDYTFTAIFDNNYLTDPDGPFRSEVLGIPNGLPINVYLLSSFNQRAQVTPGNNVFDQSALQSNVSVMMGVQKFSAPVKIDATTSNINVGFNITDTFFQKITGNSLYTENGQPVCGGNTGQLNNPIIPPLTAGIDGAYACLATTYPTKFRFNFEAN